MKTSKERPIHLRMESDLVKKLDKMAEKINLSRSELIREILKKYFNYKEPVI